LSHEVHRELGDRLLRLEAYLGRDDKEVLLVVASEAERGVLEELLRRSFGETKSPPALELLDRSAFATLERLVEAGVLQLPTEGRRVLHPPTGPEAEQNAQRELRLAAARATFAQGERKIRMASVLAGGGFPIEALPALREGVDLVLRSRAQMEGLDVADDQPLPLGWIESRFTGHAELLARLRGDSESLLGATEDEVGGWIGVCEDLAQEIAETLRSPG
jgi:hypothetical protein